MLPEKEFLQNIAEHQRIIHKVCNMYADGAHEREDLFQEILLNAWKGWKNYRGDSKFSTWLYRVALNTSITYFRKESRKPAMTGLPETSELTASADDNDSEQLAALHHAISELSKIDRALVLLYLEEYDHGQIADIMGITANNVAVRLNRIKTKLKETSKRYMSTSYGAR